MNSKISRFFIAFVISIAALIEPRVAHGDEAWPTPIPAPFPESLSPWAYPKGELFVVPTSAFFFLQRKMLDEFNYREMLPANKRSVFFQKLSDKGDLIIVKAGTVVMAITDFSFGTGIVDYKLYGTGYLILDINYDYMTPYINLPK